MIVCATMYASRLRCGGEDFDSIGLLIVIVVVSRGLHFHGSDFCFIFFCFAWIFMLQRFVFFLTVWWHALLLFVLCAFSSYLACLLLVCLWIAERAKLSLFSVVSSWVNIRLRALLRVWCSLSYREWTHFLRVCRRCLRHLV